jgi:putative membrane protein
MIRSFIFSFARGFVMGAADIVPGVSGGTIALVLGIYERLVASISAGSAALGALVKTDLETSRRSLREVEWAFLIPLLIGILAAVVSLAHLIRTLLEDEAVVMAALFVGLVAGSMVIAWMMIRTRLMIHVWVAIAVAVVVFIVLGLRSGTSEDTVSQIAQPATWAFFVSGALAICAMILPGISGSFILVMLGMYGPVLAAVTDANIAELGTFVVGAVIGLAIFSQFLNWALKHHHDIVLAGLVGLMGGSLRVLWPWPLGVDSTDLAAPNTDVGLSIVMTIVGFVAVIALSWMARRLDPVLEPSPVPD